MVKTAENKVTGGKLVRIKLDDNGSSITFCQITGDFFLHPEESLKEIEQVIISQPIPLNKESVLQSLQTVIQQHQIELIGFTPEDIVGLLLEVYPSP